MQRRYFTPLSECRTQIELEDKFFSWHKMMYPEKEIIGITITKEPCWLLTYDEQSRNPRVVIKK